MIEKIILVFIFVLLLLPLLVTLGQNNIKLNRNINKEPFFHKLGLHNYGKWIPYMYNHQMRKCKFCGKKDIK